MKEIRQCERCKEYFEEKATEKVSLGSHYEPTYSATQGHTAYDKTANFCKVCIDCIIDNSLTKQERAEKYKSEIPI